MARFKFSKVSQDNSEIVDVFYNRILKIARQCEFPDMDDVRHYESLKHHIQQIRPDKSVDYLR